MPSVLTRRGRIRLLAREAVALFDADPKFSLSRAAISVGVGPEVVGAVWRCVHPGEQLPRREWRKITEEMRAAQRASFATLQDVMLDHVPLVSRATASDIFAWTRADYGTVSERRLWRALRRLIDDGRVVRSGTRCAGSTYRRWRG